MSSAVGVIGRIDLETKKVNYLQVPIQVQQDNKRRVFSWTSFRANDDNAKGFVIRGDKRRHGHGFGHISAATPVVINDCIYFTTVLGTVYVIDAKAEVFDEKALIAVNDLGDAGKTWTLAPFSTTALPSLSVAWQLCRLRRCASRRLTFGGGSVVAKLEFRCIFDFG